MAAHIDTASRASSNCQKRATSALSAALASASSWMRTIRCTRSKSRMSIWRRNPLWRRHLWKATLQTWMRMAKSHGAAPAVDPITTRPTCWYAMAAKQIGTSGASRPLSIPCRLEIGTATHVQLCSPARFGYEVAATMSALLMRTLQSPTLRSGLPMQPRRAVKRAMQH